MWPWFSTPFLLLCDQLTRARMGMGARSFGGVHKVMMREESKWRLREGRSSCRFAQENSFSLRIRVSVVGIMRMPWEWMKAEACV
jgi:hypothetical protein